MTMKLWLDVPYAEKGEAKSLGAKWDPSARRWYAPAPLPKLKRWRARPDLPELLPGEDRSFGGGLFVDLVPSSCWFTNVRSCVTAADWDRIRRMVYGRAGHRCEACGAAPDREQNRYMEAHERWHFDEDTHTQTLRRLICLCTDCHQATHFGFAEIRGLGEQAIGHLQSVNKWDRLQAHAHIDAAWDTWEARNQHDWELNLNILTDVDVAVAPPAKDRRAAARAGLVAK